MRAMVLDKPAAVETKPLALKEVPTPGPAPGQLLIEVKACAVCRTDLHVVEGELEGGTLPVVPGHQVVGEVTELGESAGSVKVGDRVGVPWLWRTCGHCGFCRAGSENLCEAARFTGHQVDGGFAQYMVANEGFVLPVPDSYTDDQAAPLLCAGLIGYRALRLAAPKSVNGKARLGLYGFGSSAHIVIQVAIHEGCEVYVFTRQGDEKAQGLASELGATWAGSSSEGPPAEFDAAIIFAPVGDLVPLALKALRKGGTCVCAGIHMSAIPSFDYSLLWGERVLRSVANLTRRDGREFMELAPQIPVRAKVEAYGLEDANDVLIRLKSGRIEGTAVLVP